MVIEYAGDDEVMFLIAGDEEDKPAAGEEKNPFGVRDDDADADLVDDRAGIGTGAALIGVRGSD